MGVHAVVEGLGKYLSDLNSMGGATSRTAGLLGTLGGAALTAGTAVVALAAAAAAAAVVGLGVATSIGIKEAVLAEDAVAKLDATLSAIGDTTDFTSQQLRDLAMQYRDLAGGSDEAVLGAETVLLRFSQLRGEAFEPALQITLDLAAAMGTDAATAAGMLGRALEVPGEGLRALKQAGIVLTDEQKDLIDKMVETGDVAGAQTFLMDALAHTIGGTAARAAETTGGQFQILKGHLLEAAESIGAKLLPVLGDLFDKYIKPAIPVIEELARQFGTGLAAGLGDIFDAAGETAGAIGELMTALGFAAPTANDFGKTVENVTMFIADLIGWVGVAANWLKTNLPPAIQAVTTFLQPLITGVGLLVTSFKKVATESQPVIQTFLAWFTGTFLPTLAPVVAGAEQIVQKIGVVFARLGEWWTQHGPGIIAVVTTVLQTIIGTIGGVLNLVVGIINGIMSLVLGDWNGAWLAIKNGLSGFMGSILAIVGTDLGEFLSVWKENFEMARTILVAIFERIKDSVGHAIRALILKIKTIGQAIIDALPDWLIPGSPTGFEIGLRGIRQEAARMAVTVTSHLQPFPTSPGLARAGAGAGGAGGNTVIFQPTISREVDGMALLENFKQAAGRM
jgi:hypothetical protein